MRPLIARAVLLAALMVLATAARAVTVEEVVSPGGLKAYLAQDRTNPIIALSFMVRGGGALDPDAKLGLSNMAAALLDEGAGPLDDFAFKSELEDQAISLNFAADRDAVRGTLSTTTPASGKAFDLLKLALTAPRFDPEPTERVRRQIQVKLQSDAENPNRIASRTLMAALFPDHPYGRVDDGTPETVAAITADDLRQWARTRLARDRLIVAAAGDITPDQLGRALDLAFGALPATTGLAAEIPEARVSAAAREIVVDKPLPQSVILVGQPGIKRTDPDWYAAQVLDYSFGSGVFASRLMDEVREKRGLAYSVSSSLQSLDAGAFMIASAGTRSDAVRDTIAILRAEWRKMQQGGLTEAELSDAKQYLTGAWPLRFTSTTRIADMLVAVQRDNLGLDYLDKRNGYIEAVTLADTKRVAARLYRPEALTVVIVGPAEAPKPASRPRRDRERKS